MSLPFISTVFDLSSLPVVQDECYDLELYDWKKVDLSDEVRNRG